MRKKQPVLNVVLSLTAFCALLCAVILGGLFYCDHREGVAADAAEDAAADRIKEGEPPVDTARQLMDFSALQADNGDIVAWLLRPDTEIDYPVVQASDNRYYLYRDARKNANKNGSLFLDYRVPADFSGFNSVIYGHHMKSGRMFQNLVKFKDKSFFDEHASGVLYTPDKTRTLEIFAVIVTKADGALYQYVFSSVKEKEAHLRMIREKSVHYRDIGVTADDSIAVLSTCSYEYKNARTAVLARVI
jgi:sortase B